MPAATANPCLKRESRRRVWLVAMAAAIVVCSAGCVERRMTIRSNPPGALVYVDDYEVGITPISTSFIYYGQRRIRLVKDGYETLTVMQPMPPPWYDVPGVDFISENLVPGKIHDDRVFEYQLRPQLMVLPDQLRDRAEGLRRGVQASSLGRSPPPAPEVRINAPPNSYPAAPPGTEVLPTPPAVGGQPVYPLQPGR